MFCNEKASNSVDTAWQLPAALLALATAALQSRLRTKVGQSVDSAGSAAIHSQLVIMATASRGVKPNTRRLHGVIRQSFEDLFSRFISWPGASPPHRLTALLVVFRVSAAVSRALASVAFYRATAPPPRSLSICARRIKSPIRSLRSLTQ